MDIFIVISLINFILSFLVAIWGRKKRIGFRWSFFFCLFWSVIVGFIITVASSNIDEDLPPSHKKIIAGWVLLIIGSASLINFYIYPMIVIAIEFQLSLIQVVKVVPDIVFYNYPMIVITLGVITSGLYFIESGKGARLDENFFNTCKYCKSDLVLSDIELSQEKFECPNCKKVNYLNNDDITYCKYCDLEVELDSHEIKNKKFICPECNEENYLED